MKQWKMTKRKESFLKIDSLLLLARPAAPTNALCGARPNVAWHADRSAAAAAVA